MALDIGFLMMYPDEYNDGEYDDNHAKWSLSDLLSRRSRETRRTTRLSALTDKLLMVRRSKKSVDECGDRVRAIKFSSKENPELVAHMEMKGVRSGPFSSPDPKSMLHDHDVPN
jgi:hypothetical protein